VDRRARRPGSRRKRPGPLHWLAADAADAAAPGPADAAAPPHPQLLRRRLVPGLGGVALLRLDRGRVRDDARGNSFVVH
jgi:hypothetical protein